MTESRPAGAELVDERPADGRTVLEVRDLVKHYPVQRGLFHRAARAVKAVDGVSLTLDRGRTLGLVGESGSGKSTLARVLVGVEAPTSGQVLVDGEDVTRLSRAGRKQLRRDVQMVFQDPYTSLNPRMSVSEIVGEPFAIHGIDPAGGLRTAVGDLLELVGLDPDHANRYPHQFSGGQRQRVGIARALALRPKILVCDEPVSALDVSVQGQVINLLEDLQDELGLSYLFVAHDLGVVRHIAHDVAVMYLGRIVEQGPEAEVYDAAQHPYTQALLSAVPVPDPSVRLVTEASAGVGGAVGAIVLEGDPPSPADPPSGCPFHTRCWLAPTLPEATRAPAAPPAEGADAVGPGTGNAGLRLIPQTCETDVPALVTRGAGTAGAGVAAVGPGASPHVAACHFARELAAPGGRV
ncbi:dipeptide ABC transporter ATP-binding protein [Promicromonospora sukumoe]|uniref:Peptide/nickel transport system ATP-binding protein/oligopeptide transport system ATP-binding protein n=1 Tax=Promicromonospora sukumoe TaxID=88382 RepID=A0A7W3JC59_9MICO|nr:oligopeptide/dipeptide ABC transporter ATP-binding protein [Promicromonospora sukumoe]MBA8810125.1 peptide/nickel transport system ATP-binding protein/oligopeptide transport system ATP-binding protein [Promicromonospora sukumoe]